MVTKTIFVEYVIHKDHTFISKSISLELSLYVVIITFLKRDIEKNAENIRVCNLGKGILKRKLLEENPQ